MGIDIGPSIADSDWKGQDKQEEEMNNSSMMMKLKIMIGLLQIMYAMKDQLPKVEMPTAMAELQASFGIFNIDVFDLLDFPCLFRELKDDGLTFWDKQDSLLPRPPDTRTPRFPLDTNSPPYNTHCFEP